MLIPPGDELRATLVIEVGELVVVDLELGILRLVIPLSRPPWVMDPDEGPYGRGFGIPPSEVGLVGRWDGPGLPVLLLGEALDTQQGHLCRLVVGRERSSAQALLFGRSDIPSL